MDGIVCIGMVNDFGMKCGGWILSTSDVHDVWWKVP
jgi:hypothetical protein